MNSVQTASRAAIGRVLAREARELKAAQASDAAARTAALRQRKMPVSAANPAPVKRHRQVVSYRGAIITVSVANPPRTADEWGRKWLSQ